MEKDYINSPRLSYKDLYLSAFLLAKGIHPVGIERKGKEVWFIFPNENDRCRQLVESYWNEKSLVVAKKYADSLRTLKDRVFSVQ